MNFSGYTGFLFSTNNYSSFMLLGVYIVHSIQECMCSISSTVEKIYRPIENKTDTLRNNEGQQDDTSTRSISNG